jgi:hypothetical protein
MIAGYPHQITQRGNNYCLMENHMHWGNQRKRSGHNMGSVPILTKRGLRVSEWVKYSLKGIVIDIPPLEKGGEGGFENLCNVDMLPYNISLKELSGNLLIKP